MRLTTCFCLLASLVPFAPAQERPRSDDELATWLTQRIKTWQPTGEERRFDDIAWAPDIRTALALGKKHNRPIFLFTHDGHMDIGRC
jgi:hypothetical protein